MSERIVDKYCTRGASLVHQFVLMEEERQPLPEDPSPAMLVARVNERLIQASCSIEWGPPGDHKPGSPDAMLGVAAFLIGTAGFAITAIAHLSDTERHEPTRLKDLLLDQLDNDVSETLDDSLDYFVNSTPDKLLKNCLALMLGACQGVAELEDVNAFRPDEDGDDPEFTLDDLLEADSEDDDAGDDGSEDDWEGYVLEQIIESLWQTAVSAAAAGQWLVEVEVEGGS